METTRRPVRRPRQSHPLTQPQRPGRAPVTCAPGATRKLPVLPVRNAVVLPNMVVPLYLDREPALLAVEDAAAHDGHLLIVAQRSPDLTDPTADDVYAIGTECEITRTLQLPDGATSVTVRGLRRFKVSQWAQVAPYGVARGAATEEQAVTGNQADALRRSTLQLLEHCARQSERFTEDQYIQALNIPTLGALADYIVTQLEPPIQERQAILEQFEPLARLRAVSQLLRRELDVLELERKITGEVEQEADRGHREFLIRTQIQALRKELGERDPGMAELDELRERIEAAGMPTAVEERIQRDLRRLEAMPSMAPESTVIRGYLDTVLALPWRTASKDQLDLRAAAATLDAHHSGLHTVKDRILEFIAMRKLSPQGRAPVLCLVGAPGVGKTSLGRSVAEALGRQFVRISLGGVRDEAEIRGHRRTYVGALPGRIIQAIKQAGTSNPVLLLDEVDKMAADFRGDPSAALLEVLDPEQNAAFADHFLEVPFDLSKVLFILTANVANAIPGPLRDRLEMIEVPGYTEDEKLHIAKRFLIPRQMRECGLSETRIAFTDDAIRRVIRDYAFEAGVRGLEREIAAIARQVARKVAEGSRAKASITAQRVPTYLGPQRYFPPEAEDRDEVGVATGLACTSAGGELISVEVTSVPGRGVLQLTGQLGEVMRESAQAALTFARSRGVHLELPADFHEVSDLHVHLPAGGIPKDGPSAGVTMATAMISALTGKPVRRDVAMTGEITLRGRVLPVGGVKDKVLAAHRAGIHTVLLPARNLRDLDAMAPAIRASIEVIPVESMDDVLRHALATQSAAKPQPRRRAAASRVRSAEPQAACSPGELPPAARVARSRQSD
ncbi:MAG TPA: endopeptidase La [Ktedonobacterales bacterium]